VQQPYYWNGINNNASAQDWTGWVQRLYQSEQQIIQLTEKLTQIQQQLNDLSNKSPLHIEYHFDQLKVNRLEGTLNVGLSPQGIQGIESFEAPDPSCLKVTSDQPNGLAEPIRSVQTEMTAYMDDEAAKLLMEMEQQAGIALDEAHRFKVIEDVKKQLNDRVHYYGRMSPCPSNGTTEEQQAWKNTIKEKTQRDISSAFSAYLSKQQQKAGQSIS